MVANGRNFRGQVSQIVVSLSHHAAQQVSRCKMTDGMTESDEEIVARLNACSLMTHAMLTDHGTELNTQVLLIESLGTLFILAPLSVGKLKAITYMYSTKTCGRKGREVSVIYEAEKPVQAVLAA
jgi:hypothetical protein